MSLDTHLHLDQELGGVTYTILLFMVAPLRWKFNFTLRAHKLTTVKIWWRPLLFLASCLAFKDTVYRINRCFFLIWDPSPFPRHELLVWQRTIRLYLPVLPPVCSMAVRELVCFSSCHAIAHLKRIRNSLGKPKEQFNFKISAGG